MEQKRWTGTARKYRNDLPTHLAHLADQKVIGHHDAQRLAAWCATTNRPLVQAGRR